MEETSAACTLVRAHSLLYTAAGACAVQAELNEQSIREHEAYLLNSTRRRGLRPAPAAAASQEAGERAPAAADLAAGEAQAQSQQQR